MFMSLLSYLFLALIYNEIHKTDGSVSLASTVESMKDIMIVYAARGRTVRGRLDYKSETGRTIGKILSLDDLVKV